MGIWPPVKCSGSCGCEAGGRSSTVSYSEHHCSPAKRRQGHESKSKLESNDAPNRGSCARATVASSTQHDGRLPIRRLQCVGPAQRSTSRCLVNLRPSLVVFCCASCASHQHRGIPAFHATQARRRAKNPSKAKLLTGTWSSRVPCITSPVSSRLRQSSAGRGLAKALLRHNTRVQPQWT